MQLTNAIFGVHWTLRATRGRGAVPAGPRKQGGFRGFRLRTCSHARPDDGSAVVFSGGTTGTSLGPLQPPGRIRPVIGGCYGLSRTEAADPGLRSGRQRYYRGQGALAPRDSARAERDRCACAASEAQRSRPEAPLGDAGLESLRPAARPVRRRDAKQSAKLEASLGRFGLCRPILIDARRHDYRRPRPVGGREKRRVCWKSLASSSTISTRPKSVR